ncbi:MAG: transposase [Cytophagales bacterium]|nr:transposase [Cytophagales bacterium]
MLLNEVYFWTSTIVAWKHLLKQDKYKEIILSSLKNLTARKLIAVYGFTIMPNHIHVIWEMLALNKKEMPDSSFTKFTAHEFKKDLNTNHPLVLELFKSEKADREYQFWQRDSLSVLVTSREMLEQKLEYIHLNPLNEKWNLAKRPEDYPWSSASFYETGLDEFGFLTHYKERF